MTVTSMKQDNSNNKNNIQCDYEYELPYKHGRGCKKIMIATQILRGVGEQYPTIAHNNYWITY